MLLFVKPIGQVALAIPLLSILIGVFVMKRMIAFDF